MFRGQKYKKERKRAMKWQEIENIPQLSAFFFAYSINNCIFAITIKL